jgi:hypothetical protein
VPVAAEKEAAIRRATERQTLEDAEHLISVWNERQAKRMPMLFSPTIGAAIAAGYWFLRARCRFVVPRAMSTCGRSIGTAAHPQPRIQFKLGLSRCGGGKRRAAGIFAALVTPQKISA